MQIINNIIDFFKNITQEQLIDIGVACIIILIATQSSHTSMYKYLCLFLGVSIGHILNEKVIHFDPKTTVANKYIIAITGYIFCAII